MYVILKTIYTHILNLHQYNILLNILCWVSLLNLVRFKFILSYAKHFGYYIFVWHTNPPILERNPQDFRVSLFEWRLCYMSGSEGCGGLIGGSDRAHCYPLPCFLDLFSLLSRSDPFEGVARHVGSPARVARGKKRSVQKRNERKELLIDTGDCT